MQENRTTVEKFEKIFKKSSERKKERQSDGEWRKESQTWRRSAVRAKGVFNVFTCSVCVDALSTVVVRRVSGYSCSVYRMPQTEAVECNLPHAKGVFNVAYVCSTCNDVSKTLQRVTERIDSEKV